MPLYSFKCEKCDTKKDELRKMGDTTPPTCCGVAMVRVFSLPIVIIGGREATQAKLKKRSDEQGKKFFRRSAYKAEHKHAT